MLLSSRITVEWKKIEDLWLITTEVVLWANAVKDLFAGFSDFFWWRSGAYEKALKTTKEKALALLEKEAEALWADAILWLKLDFDTVGKKWWMFMVNAQWTAVKFKK